MKRLIMIVLSLMFVVGNVSALSEAQIANIKGVLRDINQKVNEIVNAREDVIALLRLDPYINDDTLIMAQIQEAKARAATAADELNTLLQ